MKILIVSKCPTHPTNAGNRWGILAQAEILKNLGNEVHFLYIKEMPLKKDPAPYRYDFEETQKFWGNHFHYFTVSKVIKIIESFFEKFDNIFHDGYYSLDEIYPYGLTTFVKDLQNKEKFDACIVNYVYLTRLFTKINFPKTAVFTHDCLSYKDLMVGEKCRTMNAHQEAMGLQRCQHIFAVQDEEMAYFHLLSPKSNVYNIYSKYEYHPQKMVGNHNIVFLSGSNIYNVNGIRWFVKDVFSLIQENFVDAKLLIGGSICKVIKDLEKVDGVHLLGFIDDPADFYVQADVAINPVYQGTGLKIKTFEAISYDKITLVHPHSMAGVFKKEKAPLFASTKPEDWVKQLDKIWNDKDYIYKVKVLNKKYLSEMNDFIISEYKRFLNS